MAEVRLSGGCQCGAVRYAITGPLINPSICHCRMCQKAFGAFYGPLVGVKLARFEITRGALSIFKSSDVVERGFCSKCGTPLTFRNLESDEMNVSIGSLDNPNAAKPIVQYGVEGRVSWIGELDALPGMETEQDADATPDHYARIRTTNHQHPDHDTDRWPPEGTNR
jgi:hypothetical protein